MLRSPAALKPLLLSQISTSRRALIVGYRKLFPDCSGIEASMTWLLSILEETSVMGVWMGTHLLGAVDSMMMEVSM